MTSRERVMTAFEHQEPDKVPRWCGASDEFWAKAKRTLGLDDEGLRLRFGDDFRRVFSRYKGPAAELE
ncbi:MAG: uroporphyrinogen-III decarboxylase, partial [Spirochaetota bacterium]